MNKVKFNPRIKKPKSVSETINATYPQLPGSGMWILQAAQQYWNSLAPVREKSVRAKRFRYGDHYKDLIYDPDTRTTMSEEKYLLSLGISPLKSNRIQDTIRNILGQYESNPPKPIVKARDNRRQSDADMMSMMLESNNDFNKVLRLNSQLLSEFLSTGICCVRQDYEFISELDRGEVLRTFIPPHTMFWNTEARDVRGLDVNFIGCYRDMSLNKLISTFAKTKEDEKALRQAYITNDEYIRSVHELSPESDWNPQFLNSRSDNNTIRIYELWRKELQWRYLVTDLINIDNPVKNYPLTEDVKKMVEAENTSRVQMAMAENERVMMNTEPGEQPELIDMEEIILMEIEEKPEEVWMYYFLTPMAQIIATGESPYLHQSHPFTFIASPLTDGVIQGLTTDMIDTQKYINRLVTLIDFVIRNSNKGILAISENAVAKESGWDIKDYTDNFTKVGGVILYADKGEKPAILSANSQNMGAFELLQLQMGLFEKISGVSGAAQGQSGGSGTPASRYAMEAQNSATNLISTFKEFSHFLEMADMKTLKLIKQYYTKPRFIDVIGDDLQASDRMWDYERVKDLDFINKIEEGVNTPAYRAMIDNLLMEMWQAQAIPVDVMISNSSLPFKDKLLEQLSARAGQQPGAQQPGQPAPQAEQQPQQPQGISKQILESL